MSCFRWKTQSCDAALEERLARDLATPRLVARCLINRGCGSSETAAHYLAPRLARLRDPFELPNMHAAVARLLQARERNEMVVVFGDYDVDGVTSTALLREFFHAMGWRSECYLPHRIDEGYGLRLEAVETCVQRFHPNLVLAVDCGSNSVEVIAGLSERGIDVIVLDHHQFSAPVPKAAAVVNPQLGTDEEARNLCSAGLAFKLVHALVKRAREAGWAEARSFDIRSFLDLVALGTIADMVPLRGENRILARVGLERLGKSERPGIVALRKVAGLGSGVRCSEVGFQLGPRLNAAGRMETALDALELLLTRDTARAEVLARALDEHNRERQGLEKKIAGEAVSAIRSRFDPKADFAIVEGRADWHLGVVGIVASRVVREFHRPVVIFGSDGSETWRGSGRSVPGFDLATGLTACADLVLQSGGHAMAAGVTISSAKVNDLRARLSSLVREALSEEALCPILELDGESTLRELDFHALLALAALQPFGQGNPPVQLVARRLRLHGNGRSIGAEGQHRRFTVTDGQTTRQAVWWNCEPGREFPAVFDLAFAPELHEYNGTFGIQLKVLDLQPSL